MKKIKIFVQGMLMGIAEIIPGVSGSTLALVMGVYDEFIDLIHDTSSLVKSLVMFIVKKVNFTDLKQAFRSINLSFGILLLTGMLTAVALFSHLFSFLLSNYQGLLYAFLFGLIIASIKIPYNQIASRGIKEFLVFIITFTSFFSILGTNPSGDVESPGYIIIFISGIIAASVMTLPGISGSFVLLIFGLYHYVLDTVKNISKGNIEADHLLHLVLFFLGVLVGLALASRTIKWAFSKHESITLAFLIGLMTASLRVLNPFQSEFGIGVNHSETLWKIALIGMGAILVFTIQVLSTPKSKNSVD